MPLQYGIINISSPELHDEKFNDEKFALILMLIFGLPRLINASNEVKQKNFKDTLTAKVVLISGGAAVVLLAGIAIGVAYAKKKHRESSSASTQSYVVVVQPPLSNGPSSVSPEEAREVTIKKSLEEKALQRKQHYLPIQSDNRFDNDIEFGNLKAEVDRWASLSRADLSTSNIRFHITGQVDQKVKERHELNLLKFYYACDKLQHKNDIFRQVFLEYGVQQHFLAAFGLLE